MFLLSKRPRYYFDAEAIREPHNGAVTGGRSVRTYDAEHFKSTDERNTRFQGPTESGANARSVWTIPTEPTPFKHFATWPQKLCQRMILAGTSERGVCPECGAPWVREVEVERPEWHGEMTPREKDQREQAKQTIRAAGIHRA